MPRHGNHHETYQAQRVSPPARTAPPTHDDIARRAYDIYTASGREDGHCERNWHQAECEMRKPSTPAELAMDNEGGATPASARGQDSVLATRG